MLALLLKGQHHNCWAVIESKIIKWNASINCPSSLLIDGDKFLCLVMAPSLPRVLSQDHVQVRKLFRGLSWAVHVIDAPCRRFDHVLINNVAAYFMHLLDNMAHDNQHYRNIMWQGALLRYEILTPAANPSLVPSCLSLLARIIKCLRLPVLP